MRSERLGEGVSAGGDAVSGNHLPNPLPPRVRRHSSTAQTPQSACDVPGSMPEATPYGNAGCVVHRACVNRRPHSVTSRRAGAAGHTSAPRSHGTARSAPKNSVREHYGGAMPGSDAAPVFSCSPAPVARVVFGTSAAPSAGTPTGRIPPSDRGLPSPSRPAGSSPRPPGQPARTDAVAPSGLRAGQTTDSDLRNHIFSANFSPLPIPWGIGRSTPLPPGKKRPGGTLPPDGDGPRIRGALPCTASE